MNTLNRLTWVSLLSACVLAACGGGDSYGNDNDGNGNNNGNPTTPSQPGGSTTTPSPSAEVAAPVAVAPVMRDGKLVSSANQRTLYTFDKDLAAPGKSVCNDAGGCIEKWPALLAKEGTVASGDFSIIQRDDGTRQWAYKQRPLYYWYLDAKAGDAYGNGIGGVWYIVPDPAQAPHTQPEPVVTTGPVLTESGKGMTLYVFDKDTAGSGKSACNAGCVEVWPPYLATANDVPHGDLSMITRDDGKMQWTYQGRPVYTYTPDTNPGDMKGDGVGGIWHVVKPKAK